LRPSLGTVDNLVPIDASPPNLRDEMCGGKRKRPASDEDEETVANNAAGGASSGESAVTFYTAGLQPPMAKASELLAAEPEASEPITVYTGPTKTGVALIAAVAEDAEKQTTRHRGKKSRVAARKPDTSSAAPATPGHANATPKAGVKPAAAADKPAKPAKPKAAAKPPAKPAPKSTTG
jgi:D-alanyl-D-alanine carboxypeptidase